jgi:hypothetical protein
MQGIKLPRRKECYLWTGKSDENGKIPPTMQTGQCIGLPFFKILSIHSYFFPVSFLTSSSSSLLS